MFPETTTNSKARRRENTKREIEDTALYCVQSAKFLIPMTVKKGGNIQFRTFVSSQAPFFRERASSLPFFCLELFTGENNYNDSDLQKMLLAFLFLFFSTFSFVPFRFYFIFCSRLPPTQCAFDASTLAEKRGDVLGGDHFARKDAIVPSNF